jgi:PEP-CTERM motif
MKSFNPSVKVLAIIGIASAITVSPAFAQPLITVDELGNGNFNGQPLPSFQSQDPLSGIVTLTYRLPFATVPGDVQLLEPGNPGTNGISDVLRFDGNGNLYFFSEREATDVPPFDPADVNQLPGQVPGLLTVAMFEVGPEGNNGALYNPAGGLPGDNSAGATYNFISDVPEPGTAMLAILGGGLWLMLRARRQNRLHRENVH